MTANDFKNAKPGDLLVFETRHKKIEIEVIVSIDRLKDEVSVYEMYEGPFISSFHFSAYGSNWTLYRAER